MGEGRLEDPSYCGDDLTLSEEEREERRVGGNFRLQCSSKKSLTRLSESAKTQSPIRGVPCHPEWACLDIPGMFSCWLREAVGRVVSA